MKVLLNILVFREQNTFQVFKTWKVYCATTVLAALNVSVVWIPHWYAVFLLLFCLPKAMLQGVGSWIQHWYTGFLLFFCLCKAMLQGVGSRIQHWHAVLCTFLCSHKEKYQKKVWHESQLQDRFFAQSPASQAIDLAVRTFRARPRTKEYRLIWKRIDLVIEGIGMLAVQRIKSVCVKFIRLFDCHILVMSQYTVVRGKSRIGVRQKREFLSESCRVDIDGQGGVGLCTTKARAFGRVLRAGIARLVDPWVFFLFLFLDKQKKKENMAYLSGLLHVPKHVLAFLILFIGTNSIMRGQEVNAVKAIARPKPDSILLRWAPSNKETWKLGNQHGYMIERITLVENKVRLAKPKSEKLTLVPIRPLPLADWEPVAKNNKYGAITAQALYGEDFRTNSKNNKDNSWQALYQKSTEEDMRFGFALFSADMDVATAKASGLRFVDKKVRKGDKYLYRIWIPAEMATSPQPKVEAPTDKSVQALQRKGVDTALVFTGTDEYAPLPKPAEFSTVFLDSTAILSWNIKVQENVYVAYDIERSSDGGLSFEARNAEPFVPILKENKNPFAFYKDSTLANVELQYRIRGLNAFGERGPYSVITKGKSQPSSQQAPKELKYELVETRKIKLSWIYPQSQINLIQGFKVYRSAEHEKGYQLISSATVIPKTQLSFVDNSPLGAGYYQVVAVDAKNQEYSSFPVLVQFEDAEPPKAPTGLKGTIDKQGKVSIAWTANKERDLLGYYVYGSNGRKDEFSRLTPDPLKSPTFADQIDLKTLTDSIYYEVLAMDKRYNESPRSLLALPRPDIIPPAPVAIIDTKGTEQGIEISWHNSSSKDAKQYVLYRFEGELGESQEHELSNNESFRTIAHKGDTTVFLDTTALVGKTYQYAVDVVDRSGLRPRSKMYSIKVQRKKMGLHAKALNFTGAWLPNNKKIVLNWKSSGSPVKHWVVYRSSQGERLAQYEAALGETFIDTEVDKAKTYQYFLRPVFLDRTMGSMSEAVKVEKLE